MRTIVLILLFIAPAFAHEPPKATGAAKQVTDVLLQNARGFERGDFQMVDRIWAHDESVTVFESGHANYGWADYRDHHLKPELEEMKNVKYRLSDVHPRVAGNTAWATFKYTISAQFREQKIDSAGVGTAVLEKRRDGWKIVHWHTSAPRRQPPQEQKP